MMFKVDVKVHVETGSYTVTGVIYADSIEAALHVFRRALAEEKGVAMNMMSPGITFFTHELLKGSLIQITPMEEE
jgi:hypothetical protein